MSERPPLPPLQDAGRPMLATGEPVLHRWFVLAMLVLVPIALGVSIWAATFVFDREVIEPADRRPPGDGVATIDRGEAELGTLTDSVAGPSCATAIRIVGDPAAHGQASRALGATCSQLRRGGLEAAEAGLQEWIANGGRLRFAVFERSGVESTLRRDEDGRLTLELNASFQFEDATRGAPAIVHQLTLLADRGFPGAPITAERALLGAQAQALTCDRLILGADEPRGCLDVAELLADPDPLGSLIASGYPSADTVDDADDDPETAGDDLDLPELEPDGDGEDAG